VFVGAYLRLIGFFESLEEKVKLMQKTVKYRPIEKGEMRFVALLAGAQAVYQIATTLGVDRALQLAFGFPGCADQSVIASTLDAATAEDGIGLRQAVEDFTPEILVLDLAWALLPASAQAEGAERGYRGCSRSKTGRNLVRVWGAAPGEIVFAEVLSGRSVETWTVGQMAVEVAERLLDLGGDTPEAPAKRARREWRWESGWGTEEIITRLLTCGYQATGRFQSPSRVKKVVQGLTTWEATSSPDRAVAAVPTPVPFARPLPQYAVRTPSKEKEHADGYSYAVLVSSRQDLSMTALVAHSEDRAGMEADLKADKHGLGLAVLRKHKVGAPKMVVLLAELAHNVLLWSRTWLAKRAPKLRAFGIVRLVHEVWAVPGQVKLGEDRLKRLRLNPQPPQVRDLARRLRELLGQGQTLGIWR
jgi:hypothetical protein